MFPKWIPKRIETVIISSVSYFRLSYLIALFVIRTGDQCLGYEAGYCRCYGEKNNCSQHPSLHGFNSDQTEDYDIDIEKSHKTFLLWPTGAVRHWVRAWEEDRLQDKRLFFQCYSQVTSRDFGQPLQKPLVTQGVFQAVLKSRLMFSWEWGCQ